MALIEGALGDPDDPAAGARRAVRRPAGDVRAVVADMRARGLTVHLEIDDGEAPAVPARVVMAMSNAAREALSNVAAHAGTGEAWVRVRLTRTGGGRPRSRAACEVIVRDRGTGFDPARVDQARLGLRRSIAERAADCGGQASVWSAPGQGTVVSLSWPAPGRARGRIRRARPGLIAASPRRACRGEPSRGGAGYRRGRADAHGRGARGDLAVARAGPGAGQLA